MSSGKDRCTASASYAGAVSQVSYSSAVVSSTSISLEWIGAITAFGFVVRKANPPLGNRTLSEAWQYQTPYVITVLAQARVAMDRMRSGMAIRAFQAVQQAAAMAS